MVTPAGLKPDMQIRNLQCQPDRNGHADSKKESDAMSNPARFARKAPPSASRPQLHAEVSTRKPSEFQHMPCIRSGREGEKMNPMCETCTFWARDAFGRALGGPHTDGSVSECRKAAPRPESDQRRREQYPHAVRVFPETNRYDWCGDWQGADATSERIRALEDEVRELRSIVTPFDPGCLPPNASETPAK